MGWHPSRRELLVAGAVGTGTLITPRWLKASQESGNWRFAFFSDTHVRTNGNIEENRAMLREIRQYAPEFAMNDGDVCEYGWEGEYRVYQGLLDEFGVPTLHSPGNHDVRWSPRGINLFEASLGPAFSHHERNGIHAFMLDTSVPLSHWGHLGRPQLEWLAAKLQDIGREAPVMLSMHHWVGRDPVRVDNEEALLDLIEQYNVAMIWTGHGHNNLDWEWNGIPCTMNQGLYQGAFQIVDVNPADQIMVRRRRVEGETEMRVVGEHSLRAPRRIRPVFALGGLTVQQGSQIKVDAQASGYRWGSGEFRPLRDGKVPTDVDIPGEHVLTLRRTDGQTYRPVMPHIIPRDPDTAALFPLWRTALPGGAISHLIAEEDGVFVSLMDGSIMCLDRRSGQEKWRKQTGSFCHSSPILAENTVCVGSADEHLYLLDRETGEQIWRAATTGPIYSSPVLVQGQWIVGAGDGIVYAFDAETGQEHWKYALPADDMAFTQSKFTTDGQGVYFGAWDRAVYALEADTGRLRWREEVTHTFYFAPAIGSPAYSAGRVVVPGNGNTLHSFNVNNGSVHWATTTGEGIDKFGYSSPLVVGNDLFIGGLGSFGNCYRLNFETGAEVWAAATGSVIYDSSPCLIGARPDGTGGAIAIGSVDGTVSLISREEGKILGQYKMPTGHLLSSPASYGRTLFVASYANQMTALRAEF